MLLHGLVLEELDMCGTLVLLPIRYSFSSIAAQLPSFVAGEFTHSLTTCTTREIV